jgi:hypothetical protein
VLDDEAVEPLSTMDPVGVPDGDEVFDDEAVAASESFSTVLVP